MHRGSIGAVGRWWVGGVGVEPHPFRCTVGHTAVTEITDGVGPVNRINTPPNFIILDEEVHFIFAASQCEIGVQRTSLRVVVAPDEQVLPGLQRDAWKRPSPRFHAPVAEKHSIAIVGYVSSIDELDPISIVSVFICSESVVDGHHFVDSNGVVSKCAPDPGHRAGRMVDGTSRIRDCGLPEDIFRAVERDDVCPAISVQSTTCGIERNGLNIAVQIDGCLHIPTGRLGQFVCPAFDAQRIIEDRPFCPALHDWNDVGRDGVGLDVGPKTREFA